PNMLDAEIGALAHRGFSDLGPGSDHHRLNTAGDRSQIVKAGIALQFLSIRIDRKDLVAPLSQALVHHVASVALRFSRNSGHRDTLAGQELRCSLSDVRHSWALLSEYV